ncbi:MAG: hypothetical protein K8R48_01110 [Alphaproteobacteria bacterium]|nr:hypothetical protein [Alphaproteobacteria bacterium]
MSLISSLFSRMTFKCLCSVFVGLVVVTMFSKILVLYGDAQDSVSEMTAQFTNSAPPNEKTLQNIARQLARESEQLSKIAPAAGR